MTAAVITAIEAVRGNITPSHDKFLKRVYQKYPYDTDKTATLDYYYVGMINDTLREIRHGHIAYIFTLKQACEVLRFEPQACFFEDRNTIGVYLKIGN